MGRPARTTACARALALGEARLACSLWPVPLRPVASGLRSAQRPASCCGGNLSYSVWGKRGELVLGSSCCPASPRAVDPEPHGHLEKTAGKSLSRGHRLWAVAVLPTCLCRGQGPRPRAGPLALRRLWDDLLLCQVVCPAKDR